MNPKVLFVLHEASRTGAPMFLLHFLRWLKRETKLEFEILLGKGGALEREFAALAPLRSQAQLAASPAYLQSFSLIYSNSVCNGYLLEDLPYGDVPIVTHLHELDMAYQWLGARKMAAVIRQSSRFVACAQTVADRFRHLFGVSADRISVHYEMVDCGSLAEASTGATEAGLALALPADAHVVVGCGTVEMRKGADLFVQAAARAKQLLGDARPLRFIWVGALKDEDLVRALRQDLRKLGLEQEVKFVGELSAPHGLLARGDVFCLTSREDPFPLAMLEAAALGRPVVGFDGSGGVVEFAAAGGGKVVPYLDSDGIAEACVEWLADPARRNSAGQRAAALVSERFSIEAVAPGLWADLDHWLQAPLAVSPHRRDESSLGDLFFGWRVDEAPDAAYVGAQLQRTRARREAAALASQGRTGDAVGTLLRAVRADIASKDMPIILEGLREIAGSLSALDEARATQLLSQAALLARQHDHLRVGDFEPKRRFEPSPAVVSA